MFINKKSLISCLILCLSLLLGCHKIKVRTTSGESYTFTQGNVTITATMVGVHANKAKNTQYPIANLFDDNPATVWSPSGLDCNVKINYTFSKPVYIEEMFILSGYTLSGKNFVNGKRAKELQVLIYPDEDLVASPGDFINHTLLDEPTIQSIPFSKGMYSNLLRTKFITLKVKSCYDENKQAGLVMTDMKFKFTEKIGFRPTMTIDEIRRRFVSDPEDWFIKTSNLINHEKNIIREDPIVDEVRANLIYYVLQGSKEAEMLLYNYHPRETFLSEEHSYYIEWYKMTKDYSHAIETK